MTALLVALGAAVGAPLRYLVDRWVGPPRSTFAVNVAGSFLLGSLLGAEVPGPVLAAAGAGFCGALTTYSAFALQVLERLEDGALRTAAGYVAASVATGVLAATAGWWLGALL